MNTDTTTVFCTGKSFPATNSPQRRGQSPLGFLYALSARVRSAFSADITADLIEEGLADMNQAISKAHESAAKVETLVERLRRHWRDFMADGQIDARERRVLERDQSDIATAAQATTHKLTVIRF